MDGLDYHDTFASVTKLVIFCTLLVVVAARNWEVHQIDVHSTFLHGDLYEEVYLKLLPGFSTGH